jgi:thiosulfate/3-mercaptopyruvate sulfurtransferase
VIRPFVLFALVSAVLGAQSPAQVVSTEWLAQRQSDPTVVLLHVTSDSEYAAGHIPGARELRYRDLVVARDGLRSELPEASALARSFEALGVSDNVTVVLYAAEAPMATRALFSLAAIGHARAAYLDGGLPQWVAEGRAISKDPAVAAAPGTLRVTTHPELVADAALIQSRIGAATSFIDTRTDGEYNGTGNRSGMPSAGHIAGARQLEWEQLFEAANPLKLKPRAELEALFAERVPKGNDVVTYCWVGYRASATWFVARMLGYTTRLYDGSYQDWQLRKLPVTAGTTP